MVALVFSAEQLAELMAGQTKTRNEVIIYLKFFDSFRIGPFHFKHGRKEMVNVLFPVGFWYFFRMEFDKEFFIESRSGRKKNSTPNHEFAIQKRMFNF